MKAIRKLLFPGPCTRILLAHPPAWSSPRSRQDEIGSEGFVFVTSVAGIAADHAIVTDIHRETSSGECSRARDQ